MPNHDRNALTIADRLQIAWVLLPAPIVAIWALVQAPFTTHGRTKSWKRNLFDRLVRWVISGTNRRQARALLGTTRGAYNQFLKENKMEPVVEEIGEDARLLWIGPKQTERVLLYLHGGAFLLGMSPFAASFWKYIQDNLGKRGKPTGVAILNYTLVPDLQFPGQLKQGVRAVRHLLDSGVKPENIQLVGDSAGAAFIYQIWSHILHPVEGAPKLELSSPFGGTYMVSPWVRLTDDEGKFFSSKGNRDYLMPATGNYWGHKVLDGLPASAIPYIEANTAPEDWLQGLEKCVKRVLISAGGAETLYGEIIKFQEVVKKHHKDVTLYLEEHGVHNEPYLSFMTKEKDLGEVTPLVLDWLDAGFEKS
ncbi:hypothetical protein NLJ89_g6622 [Agrocybe chaxingu]|uniref:Alpha/beta hydrolase fold-3 domain-containing protein n=1 Tax=Agrocybe chaxingu TaxID=84603 RepID=A0A9W8JXX8_9AGAR|nr:hypothetical protein NLJ89_g6622 [Agrocybe chaxingu]